MAIFSYFSLFKIFLFFPPFYYPCVQNLKSFEKSGKAVPAGQIYLSIIFICLYVCHYVACLISFNVVSNDCLESSEIDVSCFFYFLGFYECPLVFCFIINPAFYTSPNLIICWWQNRHELIFRNQLFCGDLPIARSRFGSVWPPTRPKIKSMVCNLTGKVTFFGVFLVTLSFYFQIYATPNFTCPSGWFLLNTYLNSKLLRLKIYLGQVGIPYILWKIFSSSQLRETLLFTREFLSIPQKFRCKLMRPWAKGGTINSWISRRILPINTKRVMAPKNDQGS